LDTGAMDVTTHFNPVQKWTLCGGCVHSSIRLCGLVFNQEHTVTFYVYGSVHRWFILIIVQRDATQSSLFIILQVHSSTWPSLATEGGSCTVPEAVVTVLCTPDDGCGWPPKHVEWTCRIINRLLCVAPRWTITDT
jgi:hypothetical protein